jgi:flagellar export protein FliJ
LILLTIENQISHDRGEIQKYYQIQEASLKGGVSGSQLQAFPMLLAAKQKNIQLLLDEKIQQERLIEQKKQELAVLRGELKVIENLKEKDYTEYRKAVNKEIDQKVEEQTQIWYINREKNQ